MASVDQQIRASESAISKNIASLRNDRSLLSQNILSQSRNLVEAIAVRLHAGKGSERFEYGKVAPAMIYVNSCKKEVSFLARFHKLLQESASHYTMEGDISERLMLKYYEHFLKVRKLVLDKTGMAILDNLEFFPINTDPSLKEYHQTISGQIEQVLSEDDGARTPHSRYYIYKSVPFFVNGKIYYEITFHYANDKRNKFDRVIAFSNEDIPVNYAANLTLINREIRVMDEDLPITVVKKWDVSIRPCEFDNFARFLDIDISNQSNNSEYKYLMNYLTQQGGSLVDIILLPDDTYRTIREQALQRSKKPKIFLALDKTRKLIKENANGSNLLRYLMFSMNNLILKQQFNNEYCSGLSNLRMQWGCKVFDEMPYSSSLIKHNPRFSDLIHCIDIEGREYELLARKVKNNVEQYGVLYTPLEDLVNFSDVEDLVKRYNAALYYKHKPKRLLINDKRHLFIQEYEDDSVSIMEKLQELSASGIGGYEASVSKWISETDIEIDDENKIRALKSLFSESQVSLVYGAAGTGKSTMINYIAKYFDGRNKLFLAHTNPAINNLERRVEAKNSTFKTIATHINKASADEKYDVLIIDECSTVSNSDMLKILQRTDFKLLVLVGDIYQIESIQFGNWFGIAPYFIPKESVFELTKPWRTKNDALLQFWHALRNLNDNIAEIIAHNSYSSALDRSIFNQRDEDEILLCLNYDGLYGINNINRFLQASNTGATISWGVSTYKVGDPVLFNDSTRFRGVIYNNLKGKIMGIALVENAIQFDIELDRYVTDFDVLGLDMIRLDDKTVRFLVYEHGNSDEDTDTSTSNVPFQVAYAVSIHKAQGLEYEKVKIVITDANEGDVSHSILYTAVTRARNSLVIYWSPEVQQSILSQLNRPKYDKEVQIISSRRGLKTE